MKLKLFLAMVALLLAMPTTTINAEPAAKLEKADKQAKKQAKEFKKEGYKVKPGNLPLENQLDRIWTMKAEHTDDGMDKYFFGEASSIGQNYDAAKMQAMTLARQDLAAHVEANVTEIINSAVANQELEPGIASSVSQAMSTSKTLISQKLRNIITVVECYRQLPNGNTEVLIQVATTSATALATTHDVLEQELQEASDELNKIFNRN